jgi:hypothetical protein
MIVYASGGPVQLIEAGQEYSRIQSVAGGDVKVVHNGLLRDKQAGSRFTAGNADIQPEPVTLEADEDPFEGIQ